MAAEAIAAVYGAGTGGDEEDSAGVFLQHAGIGHGGIVVFDDTVDLARQAHYAFEFCEVESCGKCMPCRLGSVRGKETMSGIIEGRDVEQKLTIIEDLCEVMETASLCQMGGMTPIPVMSAIKRFPEDFRR